MKTVFVDVERCVGCRHCETACTLEHSSNKEFIGEKSVEYLLTSDGKQLKGDIYIAATGVKPNIDFIKGTDIEYNFGIKESISKCKHDLLSTHFFI